MVGRYFLTFFHGTEHLCNFKRTILSVLVKNWFRLGMLYRSLHLAVSFGLLCIVGLDLNSELEPTKPEPPELEPNLDDEHAHFWPFSSKSDGKFFRFGFKIIVGITGNNL